MANSKRPADDGMFAYYLSQAGLPPNVGSAVAHSPSFASASSMTADSTFDFAYDDSGMGRKRKRVMRACDECRKKKVKCDGLQPCTHCSVYSHDCSYDQPSLRRKAPEGLRVESRLKFAESIIDSLLPGVDIYSPNFDMQTAISSIDRSAVLKTKRSPSNTYISSPHAKSDSLFSSPNGDEAEFRIILPPKQVAIQLIEAVWDNPCVMFRLYHRPSFIRDLDLLYETDPDDFTDKQFRLLPLMYSIMAVGVLFSADKLDKLGFTDGSEGYKFFIAARKLIDITDARDIYAIQTIVMMILFLQCSARLSTCYSYIGIAVRAALRAGLHRKVNHSFDPIELETRKRLFWTIRKLDIYINSILGLPISLCEEDYDQEMPMEIDDENITEDGYFPQKENKLSSAGIANAHTRLMEILGVIIKKIYPVQQQAAAVSTGNKQFSITYATVAEIEKLLEEWLRNLPAPLLPGAEVADEYVKANRLLALAYLYTQMVLFRPFIHYLNPTYQGNADDKAKFYARKCISVARQVIYIANDLVSRNMLNGAYWFSVYSIFFSVSCLVYYCHENFDEPDVYEIQADAEIGKSALDKLKYNSTSATRTYNLLNGLFDQLNKRTAKLRSAQRAALGNVAMPEVANYGNGDVANDGWTRRASVALPEEGRLLDRLEVLGRDFVTRPSLSDVSAPSTYDYVPGLMDQVDVQLFGRFLPPYMMPSKGEDGGAAAGVDIPQGTGLDQIDALHPAPPAGGLGPLDGSKANRRTSIESFMSSKSWDEFVNQNSELSGMTSFMGY